MYKFCKVWTMFAKDEAPLTYDNVHDVHIGGAGNLLIVVLSNGDQHGFYMPNVRHYELIKANE